MALGRCRLSWGLNATSTGTANYRDEGEETMIARIWQGRTRPGMGKPYLSYLEQTGLKEYKPTEGFKDVLVLTREIGDETEYVLITLWDNMEAVQRFAGLEPERAVYYPEDDHYFPEHERTTYVRHYEVAARILPQVKSVGCRPQPA